MKYPYLVLAEQTLERLRSLEVTYPSNIHEWRLHKAVISGYLGLTKNYEFDKYYPKLVKYTDEAIDYIERWLTKLWNQKI